MTTWYEAGRGGGVLRPLAEALGVRATDPDDADGGVAVAWRRQLAGLREAGLAPLGDPDRYARAAGCGPAAAEPCHLAACPWCWARRADRFRAAFGARVGGPDAALRGRRLYRLWRPADRVPVGPAPDAGRRALGDSAAACTVLAARLRAGGGGWAWRVASGVGADGPVVTPAALTVRTTPPPGGGGWEAEVVAGGDPGGAVASAVAAAWPYPPSLVTAPPDVVAAHLAARFGLVLHGQAGVFRGGSPRTPPGGRGRTGDDGPDWVTLPCPGSWGGRIVDAGDRDDDAGVPL